MIKTPKEENLKIKFRDNAVLSAHFDKIKFEKELKKKFDFKTCVLKSIHITEINKTGLDDEDELKKFIYLGVNWRDIFMNWEKFNADKIKIDVISIGIENFRKYEPNTINSNNDLIYKGLTENFGDYVFIHYVGAPDLYILSKYIEYSLSTRIIDYIDKKWKREIKLN